MQKKPRRWPQQVSHEASELLFSLANCSAVEQWVTLDRLFWPRQLLITKCAGAVESFSGVPGGPIAQSCGWPPGKLACRNVPVNVTILRWLCMPK
jgi:Noggin